MSQKPDSVTVPPHTGLKSVLGRNIEALIERRRAEELRRSAEDRLVAAVTRFVGSMKFVYLFAVLIVAWLAINLGWLPGPRFDPDFFRLATFTSVMAIFLSTFVLINQNRQAGIADKRADLDLQISLLSEHELTRLLQLLTQLAERLDVDPSRVPELNELTQDIAPERVLDKMESTARELEARADEGDRPAA